MRKYNTCIAVKLCLIRLYAVMTLEQDGIALQHFFSAPHLINGLSKTDNFPLTKGIIRKDKKNLQNIFFIKLFAKFAPLYLI